MNKVLNIKQKSLNEKIKTFNMIILIKKNFLQKENPNRFFRKTKSRFCLSNVI